jgi:hypothetical protein
MTYNVKNLDALIIISAVYFAAIIYFEDYGGWASKLIGYMFVIRKIGPYKFQNLETFRFVRWVCAPGPG